MDLSSKRLVEVTFPLKPVSIDSVHEKNVRHGHISTLHIWPARRPLAACRAVLIATLLSDPGSDERRKVIMERLAGRVVQKVERKRVNGRLVETVREETAGGILHWGRENDEDVQWFRKEIRKAYGGRAPKVLDPFAGGGAIPLEAMRLGCDVSAVDINPVAWFILKCALDYPQRLGGWTHPLPEFAVRDAQFMAAYLKTRGFKGATLRTLLQRLGHSEGGGMQLELIGRDDPLLDADFAWHVRAWGSWVLRRARKELVRHYPTYAEFVSVTRGSESEPRSIRLLKTDDAGEPLLDTLNAEFDSTYLGDPGNPRWVAKSTVGYLHARTVTCKQCRGMLPLLKTRWLCKKDRKRVLLTTEPDNSQAGVVFGVQADVPQRGGNAAQSREHDKRIGAGTMSRTGATCPRCRAIMTMEDIRLEGRAGRLGTVMTAVVVHGPQGKEYRLPTEHERGAAEVTEEQVQAIFADIPFQLPDEPTPKAGSGASRAFSVDGYGFDTWRKLFTNRQLLALGVLVRTIRQIPSIEICRDYGEPLRAVVAMLAAALDRAANYMSTLCIWEPVASEIKQTFLRFALPITWDFAEGNPLASVDRLFAGGVSNVARVLDSITPAIAWNNSPARVLCQSAIVPVDDQYDIVVTDPPYYDANTLLRLDGFLFYLVAAHVVGARPGVR